MKNWKSYASIFAWSALVLLLIPPLWYSLRTPFGLIDDYSLWYILQSFSSVSGFIHWFQITWLNPLNIFRITNDIYQYLTWTFLGDNAWLHHAARWVLKVVVVVYTFKIFRLLTPKGISAFGLPFWVFCCVYIFFPNNPEARLGPAELFTAFFLSGMFYELCRLCIKDQCDLGAMRPVRYGWLLLFFTGVLWSKEPNIVMGIVTTGILICLNLKRWKHLLPFVLITLITAARVWAKKMVGGYGVVPITGSLISHNFIWYTKSLFLLKTSFLCTFFLLMPSLGGFIGLIVQSWKTLSEKNYGLPRIIPWAKAHPAVTFYWLFFLNMCAFYAITMTYWVMVLRYFYPMVFLLALWIGLSLLELDKFSFLWRRVISAALIILSVYYVGANYYNFVYQFACQYYTRKVEHDVLLTSDRLLKEGMTVTVKKLEEYEYNIDSYFNYYLPYFKKTNYRLTIVPPQPANINQCYYIAHQMQPYPAFLNWYHQFNEGHVSRILSAADSISSWFQFGHSASTWNDAGAPGIGRHAEDTSIWYMYECKYIWPFQEMGMDQQREAGQAYIMKSLNDLQNKNLNSSITDLESSINADPTEPEAYLLLGQILLNIKAYSDAIDFLNMAAKAFPDNGNIFYMLAIAYKMKDYKPEAVVIAHRCIDIFGAQHDQENLLKSNALLQELQKH